MMSADSQIVYFSSFRICLCPCLCLRFNKIKRHILFPFFCFVLFRFGFVFYLATFAKTLNQAPMPFRGHNLIYGLGDYQECEWEWESFLICQLICSAVCTHITCVLQADYIPNKHLHMYIHQFAYCVTHFSPIATKIVVI